jgi:cytochrome c peroxidase
LLFDQNCAACHAEASGRVGRPLPLAQVGTNKDRLDTWGKKYAIESNKVVRNFGIERRGLVEEDSPGYNVPHLDGIWLRAPYLHNGSVPSLRDLLRPPAERPQKFYRGYDVYDPVNMGFITQGPEAEKVGTLHDVSRKGNGNGGHLFGTSLRSDEKETLLEYLKTL